MMLSFLLSSTLSLVLTLLLFFIQNKKEKKKYSSMAEKKEVERFGYNLLLQKEVELDKILSPLKQGYDHYFTLFNKQLITIDDLLPLLKDSSSMLVFCYSWDKSVKEFLSHIPSSTVKIVSYEDIYQLLKNTQSLPTLENKWVDEKHTTFKQLLSTALRKDKSKSYLLSGLFLSAGSLFLRYNIYYIIMSSFLFLLALYSLCNHRFNEKK